MNRLRPGLAGLLLLLATTCHAGDTPCPQDGADLACRYRQAGIASCQDLRPTERPACLQRFTPPLLCQRERQRQHCEQLAAAQQQCQPHQGAARRACVAATLPPPACSRGSDHAHCARQQAAWRECAALFGSQQRQCLHQAMRRQMDGATR